MHRVKKVSPESRKAGLGSLGYTSLFRKPRGKWVHLLKKTVHQRPGQEKRKAG